MKRTAMIVLFLANFISAMNSFPLLTISEESKSTFPFSAIIEACPVIFDQPKDSYVYYPICDPDLLLTQRDHDELTQIQKKFSQETLIDLSIVLTTSVFNTDEDLPNTTIDFSEEGNELFITPQANASILSEKRNGKYESILLLINIEDLSMIASARKSLRKAISHLRSYIHLDYIFDDFNLVRDEVAGSLHFIMLNYPLSSRHLKEHTDQDAERTTNWAKMKPFSWLHLDVEIIITFFLVVAVSFLSITIVVIIAKLAANFVNPNSNAYETRFEPYPVRARVKTRVDNPFECHECVICMEKYISFKERIGSDNQSLKVLSCGHSLDRSCWRLYKQADSTNKASCPVCRQRLNSSSSSLSSSSISCPLPHNLSIPDSSENDDANTAYTNLNRHHVLSYSDEEEANFVHRQNRYQDAWEDQMLANIRIARNQEDQMLANIRIARNQVSYGSTAIETVYGTNTMDHQNPLSLPLPLHPVYHHRLDSHSQEGRMFPMRNDGQNDNNIYHMPTSTRLYTAFSRDDPNQRRTRRERQNQIYRNNTSFMRQDRITSQRDQEYSRSRERRDRRTRNVAQQIQNESSLIGLVVESPRDGLDQNNRASSGRRNRRTAHHGRTAASYSYENNPSTSYVSEHLRTDFEQISRARRHRRSRRNRNNGRSTSYHFETEFSLFRNRLDPTPQRNRRNGQR